LEKGTAVMFPSEVGTLLFNDGVSARPRNSHKSKQIFSAPTVRASTGSFDWGFQGRAGDSGAVGQTWARIRHFGPPLKRTARNPSGAPCTPESPALPTAHANPNQASPHCPDVSFGKFPEPLVAAKQTLISLRIRLYSRLSKGIALSIPFNFLVNGEI
jgi:hypothetical protein